MSTPVLHPGDQIHVAVPASASDDMIEDLKQAYVARGITIFRVSVLSSPDIEVVSIIRATELWQYGVKSGDEIRLFATYDEAKSWSLPTDEGHAALPVLRRRWSNWQVAML
jgi:hypothetical protein